MDSPKDYTTTNYTNKRKKRCNTATIDFDVSPLAWKNKGRNISLVGKDKSTPVQKKKQISIDLHHGYANDVIKLRATHTAGFGVKREKKHRTKLNNHLDFKKRLSFMYETSAIGRSAIKTKIINKKYPELFTDKFPELLNLRQAAQVDVHNLTKFQEAKKTMRFLNPNSQDGYRIKPKLKFNIATRCIKFMPNEDRREDIAALVEKYKQKLDDIRNQIDLWKIIKHELTDRRQTKIMLKVLKNNLVFLSQPEELDIYR